MADQKLSNDFQFRDVPRQDPAKKPMVMRTEDFVEIFEAFRPGRHASISSLLECGNLQSGSVRYIFILTGSS